MAAASSGNGSWRAGTAGAALLLVGAWGFFTIEMILVRELASELNVIQTSFFRATVQFVALLPLILWRPVAVLRTRRLGLFVVRAGSSALVMPIYYTAFAILPFAVVTTVTFSQALFLVILAAFIGQEQVGPRRWIATGVGFLGVLVIMRPGQEAFEPGVLLALLGAVISAYLMLLTRRLGRTESGLTIMTYVCLLSGLMLALPAWWVWQEPTAMQWQLLITLGLVGTVGQFMFVHAFKRAEASALAPIDYIRLIFAVIAGYWLYDELPDLWTWAGAAIIIVSALTVTRLEQRAEKRSQ